MYEEPVVGGCEAVVTEPEIRQVGLRFDSCRPPCSSRTRSRGPEITREPDRVPRLSKQPTSARRRWLCPRERRFPESARRDEPGRFAHVRETWYRQGSAVEANVGGELYRAGRMFLCHHLVSPSAGPGFVDGQARQPRRSRRPHIHEPPVARCRGGELAPLGLSRRAGVPQSCSASMAIRDGARWFPVARRALRAWNVGDL